MKTYGFIVGIEKYHEPTWDIPGPCLNAIAATKWLVAIGTREENIHLFLCPSRDDLEPEIAALETAGVRCHRTGDHNSIDTFWRTELAKGIPAGSRLLVFWSGHGFTSSTRSRIFFCSDYQPKLPNRVFNGTNFLNHLLTADYACFSDQLILADVCGVYSDVKVDETLDPLTLGGRDQLAYFATQEGQYAKGNDGRGAFTTIALDVLHQSNEWPVQQQFIRALEQAMAETGTAPFRIGGLHNSMELRESIVGSLPPNDGNVHFQSAFAMLSKLDVVENVFRPHYLNTVNDLGNPALAKAQGLIGALQELAALRDADVTKGVPRGLLQFLVRLAGEANLTVDIENWLEIHAAGRKNTLADIRSKLAIEDEAKILVINTEVDATGEVAGYKPYLCNKHYSIVPDWRREVRKTPGWRPFETSLQKLLREFVTDDRLSNLEIHFVVGPSLFNRAFHMIPLASGEHPIGQDVVVVVRHKQRFFNNDPSIRGPWQDYADTLRAKGTKTLKWLKLAADGGVLPKNKGLFFATFTLPDPVEGKPTGLSEKQAVLRLLKFGIPYIYLPHGAPGPANWNTVAKELRKLLREKPTLGEFPSTLRQERIRGSQIGARGTMIWDDPMAVLPPTEGVRFG